MAHCNPLRRSGGFRPGAASFPNSSPIRRCCSASRRQQNRLRPGNEGNHARHGKDHPAADEMVTVDYTIWTTDGKMFASSVARGKPATFSVNRVIPGLGEGLRLMVTGETLRLWIPESLAYKGQSGKPAGMLVLDVTLIDLPTRAPADVKAPPPDAKRTPSGLAYKVLTPGTGTRHPRNSIRSPSTTPGGRQTGKCSTARWRGASHRPFRSTA